MAQVWQFSELGGPEVLRLVEEESGRPGAGEARVRIRAVGLNRSELMYLAGRYFGAPPLPSCLGQEAVGEVLELGPPGDTEPVMGPLKVGDRVGLMVGRVDYRHTGTYRSEGIYPQAALLPVPSGYSDGEGAGLWLAGLTAIGGLWIGGLRPGGARKRVLVTAASSGVGVLALQIARAWGGETIAATTSAEKRESLKGLADAVLVTGKAEDLAEQVREATEGAGADIAFDPVGFAWAEALFEAAAQDGQVVFYGIMAGTEAPFDLRNLILKDLGVHGYTVLRFQRDPEILEALVRELYELAESGRVRPPVAASFPFEEAPAALEAMRESRHLGKIVLTLA